MDLLTLDFLTLGISDNLSDIGDSPIQEQPFLQSPTQSPPRKRPKSNHSITPVELSFASFDSLPVYARGAPKWNSLLAANPAFWIQKCESWYKILQIAFDERNVR